MLYLTTHKRTDSYTAHKVLFEEPAPDEGAYLPIRLPVYDASELGQLEKLSFSQTVAKVLNQFFTTNVTGWDIELCTGKTLFRLVPFGRKLYCAQFWRNSLGDSDFFISRVYGLLCGDPVGQKAPTRWASTAIRIAMFFGLYTQLVSQNIRTMDIALSADVPEDVIAGFLAKKMGLPLETVVCGCTEGSGIWQLIHKGELTGPKTCELEQLIFVAFGYADSNRYLNSKTYQLEPEQRDALRGSLFASVIGRKRISDLINSIYRTDKQIIDPDTARAYGALQDLRTRTGESRPTLLLCHTDPMRSVESISEATGLKPEQIQSVCAQ